MIAEAELSELVGREIRSYLTAERTSCISGLIVDVAEDERRVLVEWCDGHRPTWVEADWVGLEVLPERGID